MIEETYLKIGCLALSLIIGLFMPLLLDGIGRKIKARIQYRMGPPILQTFYDVFKLLKTPSLIPGGIGFIIAPIIAFSAALISMSVLPIGLVSPISFSYDIFVYLYVLAMVSVALMLAGFSVQNAYANIGANREMMMILSIEPILGIVLGTIALVTGSLSIEKIVLSAGFLDIKHLILYIFSLIMLTYTVYVECGFIPFDLAEAETEILEGPLVEYSGRLLGLFKWALLIKRFSLIWLFTSLLTAPLLIHYGVSLTTMLFSFIVQLVVATIIYCCMVTYEAMTPRYKIDWVIKSNLKIFLLSIVYLIIVLVIA